MQIVNADHFGHTWRRKRSREVAQPEAEWKASDFKTSLKMLPTITRAFSVSLIERSEADKRSIRLHRRTGGPSNPERKTVVSFSGSRDEVEEALLDFSESKGALVAVLGSMAGAVIIGTVSH